MTDNEVNIFDQFGAVRDDIDEAFCKKCSPLQLEALMPTLSSWADTKLADSAYAEAIKNQRKAVTAVERAKKALEDVKPQRTFHQEWLRTVVGQPEPPVDPAVTKRIKSAEKLVVASEEALADTTALVRPAYDEQQRKRAIYAERLLAWRRVDGRPKNTADLVRQRALADQKAALANIEAGYPPEHAVQAASTVGPSFLDKFRAGQGKGHSVNQGYHRNSMRGGQLAPKLPSEK